MPVEVATVERRTVADRFEAVGTVESDQAIVVVTEVAGTLERLPFREGDAVQKGAVLAEMDDDKLRAERDRTEALRDQARITFDRTKALVESGAGAQQNLDDAAAGLKVAEANFALAAERLSDARITAPFSGTVGSRLVNAGAYLESGQPITNLARLDDLRVMFAAPERYLGRLERGAPVEVSVTAYPGYALTGEIHVVDPVLDPATRSARVVARVKNPGGKLRPGMSVNVSTLLDERPGALTVPSEAVVSEANQTLVYVVNPDSSVAPTPVELGTRLSDVVEVLSGVSEGAVVVRAGHQKLFPGAKVMPMPAGGMPGMGPGGMGRPPGAGAPGGGEAPPAEGGPPAADSTAAGGSGT
jgi:membrane fusion protein (multidrug efflux system)